MPANLENSAVVTGLEKVSFHSNPKERHPNPPWGWVARAPTPAADLGCLRAAREPLRIWLPSPLAPAPKSQLLGSKIIADGDCSHEIKRDLHLGRKAMTNLDSILKSRDITLPTKVCKISAGKESACIAGDLDLIMWTLLSSPDLLAY